MPKECLPTSIPTVLLLLPLWLAGCSGPISAAHAPPTPEESGQLAQSGKAVDWPQWRGPQQNGISPEIGWSVDWPVDGPPVRWQANVGIGFSSLAVADGYVYTMGHEPVDKRGQAQLAGWKGEGADPRRGTDTVWCLAAGTGEVRWTHSYPSLLVDNLHEGGPAATPTVRDGCVYTLSKEGHLLCLDAERGDVLWQRKLTDDLGVPIPEWGFSGSPLVDGDLVVVDGGRVAAYHRATGELIWQTEEFKAGYGTPVTFSPPDAEDPHERLVAVLNNECLIVLRLQTGQEIARRKWTSQYNTTATTPAVVGSTIFVSSGYRRGCLLTQLESGRLVDIYENQNMCNHMNNSVLWDGHWYGFDGNSHRSRTATLTCIEYGSGEVQWTQRGLGCGSLMVAGGKLVCLSDDGEIAIVEPNPRKYEELARAKILQGRCWTVPVLSGGHLYARNADGHLVCCDFRGA